MDTVPAFTLFDTAIGRCAIAWAARGIVGVQLPEASDEQTRARLLRRQPEAREAPPPPEVQDAIGQIQALLRGEASDLAAIPLDMDGVPDFHRRVYAVARTTPPGTTLTYGAVAARLDAPGAARAVGRALGENPFAIVVPCHRVLGAGGKTGGFTADGGVATKLRMLSIERAQIGAAGPRAEPGLFDDDAGFGFVARPGPSA